MRISAPTSASRRQPLRLPLPAPPPAQQRGMKAPVLEGPSHFFRNPDPLPSVAERVRAVIASIDWSAPAVMVWVPGTSEYWIKQRAVDELAKLAPRLRATMIPYEASWRFSSSVPDGAAVLRGVLQEVARRAPGKPVLLAGESQGAWVISEVLKDSRMARLVTRASIWGHPGAAPQKFGRPGQVREKNRDGDVVTLDLGPKMPQIMEAVELLARRHLIQGAARIAAYAVQQPQLLLRLFSFWKFALPGNNNPQNNAHDYEDDYAAGLRFLMAGVTSSQQPRPRVHAGARG